MDIDLLHETIKQLREELEHVNRAILQVEAIADGRNLKGRPAKAVARAREKTERQATRIPPKRRRRTKPKPGDNDR